LRDRRIRLRCWVGCLIQLMKNRQSDDRRKWEQRGVYTVTDSWTRIRTLIACWSWRFDLLFMVDIFCKRDTARRSHGLEFVFVVDTITTYVYNEQDDYITLSYILHRYCFFYYTYLSAIIS